MIYPGNTTAGQQSALYDDLTFDSILDETCERLLDRQVKYAIQRIHEMEQRLTNLERELDEFLSANKKHKAKSANPKA
jgi:sugar diacid utilization regulator